MNNLVKNNVKIDKQKMYFYLILLSWFTIILSFIIKIFGFKEFEFPEYTYNINVWVRRFINCFFYCLNGLCFALILVKRKLKFKEILIVLSLNVFLFIISLFEIMTNFTILFEFIIYFLIGIILIKDKWYKILLETFIILLIFTIYQLLTMFYKNINIKINVDNFIIEKILYIDYYMLLLLTILHNLKEGDYIYGRWKRFLAIFSKRKCFSENVCQNQKTIQNEIGFKIFIVVLSIFQIFLVGTLCYFVNKVIFQYIIIIISFFIMRKVFGKSYHANSVIKCTTLSILVFVTATRISMPLNVTIILNVLIGCIVAYAMFVMYYFIKYTTKDGITICKGISKDILLNLCNNSNLNELETNILIMFYCERKSITYIANKMNYSYDNIWKLKSKALTKIK